MIKIRLCDGLKSSQRFFFNVLDDNEDYTSMQTKTTKKASLFSQKERACCLKSEVTDVELAKLNIERLKQIKECKDIAKANGKKLISEGNHELVFENDRGGQNIEVINFPCPQDIEKIKADLKK
tara:strand:- start:332 stop:703 length:372 start_codon:yes stop_codon:yes gene_type:complete